MKITPKPHTGCKKFRARFGLEALKWINAPENKALRLRGLHAEVLEPGEVAVGDAVVVV
jgi:MOSC domain-containing protein YiiM